MSIYLRQEYGAAGVKDFGLDLDEFMDIVVRNIPFVVTPPINCPNGSCSHQSGRRTLTMSAARGLDDA